MKKPKEEQTTSDEDKYEKYSREKEEKAPNMIDAPSVISSNTDESVYFVNYRAVVVKTKQYYVTQNSYLLFGDVFKIYNLKGEIKKIHAFFPGDENNLADTLIMLKTTIVAVTTSKGEALRVADEIEMICKICHKKRKATKFSIEGFLRKVRCDTCRVKPRSLINKTNNGKKLNNLKSENVGDPPNGKKMNMPYENTGCTTNYTTGLSSNSNCANGCSGNCSGNCSGSCSGGCSGNCSGNCSGSCSNGRSGGCINGCISGCISSGGNGGSIGSMGSVGSVGSIGSIGSAASMVTVGGVSNVGAFNTSENGNINPNCGSSTGNNEVNMNKLHICTYNSKFNNVNSLLKSSCYIPNNTDICSTSNIPGVNNNSHSDPHDCKNGDEIISMIIELIKYISWMQKALIRTTKGNYVTDHSEVNIEKTSKVVHSAQLLCNKLLRQKTLVEQTNGNLNFSSLMHVYPNNNCKNSANSSGNNSGSNNSNNNGNTNGSNSGNTNGSNSGNTNGSNSGNTNGSNNASNSGNSRSSNSNNSSINNHPNNFCLKYSNLYEAKVNTINRSNSPVFNSSSSINVFNNIINQNSINVSNSGSGSRNASAGTSNHNNGGVASGSINVNNNSGSNGSSTGGSSRGSNNGSDSNSKGYNINGYNNSNGGDNTCGSNGNLDIESINHFNNMSSNILPYYSNTCQLNCLPSSSSSRNYNRINPFIKHQNNYLCRSNKNENFVNLATTKDSYYNDKQDTVFSTLSKQYNSNVNISFANINNSVSNFYRTVTKNYNLRDTILNFEK
ncbi:conserved Plasmodium protein, unknown function [Plasmodium malariae]|uniref:Uncharacterized protein n=1 Tax=Plasmodium malariae TaxID=5858 RepID=A0A1A8WH65_PLAMA|nr:conserved Plasmodium protein, unknown function [Plasmodium malariae]